MAFGPGLPGAAGSLTATIHAVAKTNGPNAPYCVPNELICGTIGRSLGLPVPPGGIIDAPATPARFYYASLDFNLTGNTLPPADPHIFVSQTPCEATGLLLFDILVANSDRHAGNLYLDASSGAPSIAVFDHSHALFGSVAGQGQARLTVMKNRLAVTGNPPTGGNRHCLLSAIDTDVHFNYWLDRIKALPVFLIGDVCSEAAKYGITSHDAAAAAKFLCYRRTALRQIIRRNRAEFGGIRQWGLFT